MGVRPEIHDWFVPLSCSDRTLRETRDSLNAIGLEQRDIPLLVRLVENPEFDLPLVEFRVLHQAYQQRDIPLL